MTTFSEIFDFDLDDLIPQLGWIGNKSIKIYRNQNSAQHYLFDSETGRLYEVHSDVISFNNVKLYDDVVTAYRVHTENLGL